MTWHTRKIGQMLWPRKSLLLFSLGGGGLSHVKLAACYSSILATNLGLFGSEHTRSLRSVDLLLQVVDFWHQLRGLHSNSDSWYSRCDHINHQDQWKGGLWKASPRFGMESDTGGLSDKGSVKCLWSVQVVEMVRGGKVGDSLAMENMRWRLKYGWELSRPMKVQYAQGRRDLRRNWSV